MKRVRMWRVLTLVLVFAMVAAACGDDDAATTTTGGGTTATTTGGGTTATTTGGGEPVVVCELAYYTGEFAPYGPSLTDDIAFPIDFVINEDPPLGRPWTLVSEDLGTVGEAQAARTCLENHGAEILVSQAHGYRTYRDYMIEWVAEHDGPLGPSVHGGTIPGNLGGKASEPIFRAQGLDEALGMTGILYAESIGAETVVIFATEVEGFQIAANAAERAAEAVGIEVLARIDAPAEQASYRAEAEQIATLAPDAVIVQAGSVESATLIKQAAEAGLSLDWIGESGWVQPEFMNTLGVETLASQQSVGFAGFAYDDTTPAWDFFQPLWDGAPGHGPDEFGDATGLYHFSTYDLMVQTALAVEYGGSYLASDWAPAMHEVGEAPGTVCYTYADCLALIRAGEDVDYEGITGNGTYTDGGVNHVVQSYTPYNADGTKGAQQFIDAERALEVLELIAVDAVCDADNVCTW
ncbi:MAG: ABC transporter substrate-binding protein [Acidimicrobiia bacterium]|nr:ABC transporter substrate-binding protein [Acidimicrobiia bacterium]